MIKRIVVCGVIHGSAHIIYDIIIKAQRNSMAKAIVGNTWEMCELTFFDHDQELVIKVPSDWDNSVELCNWLKDTYEVMQVMKAMPVRVGQGGKMEVIRLKYYKEPN
jgi:hypothetical protein